LPAGAEDSAADEALAKVVENAAALARNTSAEEDQPHAALEAAVAAVPQPPPAPDVPLPEALLATAEVPEARLPEIAVTDPVVLESLDSLKTVDVGEVQDDPSAANGAAAAT
jgi:hypothetical protein